MEIPLKHIGKVLIAQISGELDHHAAANIRESIDKAARAHRMHDLILDFSQLEFMDSSGIGMIVGRYKLFQSLGGKVVLIGVSSNMLRLIRLAGLHKILPIADSLKEALEFIEEGRAVL